jgi:P-type Cu+ transporter
MIERPEVSGLEQSLKIGGMTCAACAKRIEKVTKKLEGVQDSSVNYATEKLSIQYDESVVSLPAIRATIEKAGYEAIIESAKRVLQIEGMTCAACAKRIEKVTSKLDGVLESSVNYATEKLSIALSLLR